MEFIDNVDIEKYDEFVMKNVNCNIFQSSKWLQIKDTWNYKRFTVLDDYKNIILTAQVLIRKGLWYLPRGPILDYEDLDLLEYFLNNIKIYAKKSRAKLLKINIPRALKVGEITGFNEVEEDVEKTKIMGIFKKLKFKHGGFPLKMSETIQPRFEAVTFLDENFEDNLPRHTKRLVKDVEKSLLK